MTSISTIENLAVAVIEDFPLDVGNSMIEAIPAMRADFACGLLEAALDGKFEVDICIGCAQYFVLSVFKQLAKSRGITISQNSTRIINNLRTRKLAYGCKGYPLSIDQFVFTVRTMW